ncbi:baseplate J/gp47 family protein [Vibrio mangrovi]|uniref:Baseplate J/gp47 family protein n=1 Tax=Vibrio mangrovi TaxID=474394 RepID=A0A1Y6IZQ5_9VIBR|nr:baseplate J/gp47 family protein [Vibrio mangrovi]MDW6002498.1 baseplate J/gp47 family protein [Vibrio mangrovi]SMS01972.1 hypothetical protein VIM7927_03283 [Vibrio mangrovi]
MRNHADTDALLRDISARLDPDNILVDDRSIRDRLAFIAAFAELIVFYDEHNQPAGNWRAFVIKDPVILLAVISKTSYQGFYENFSRIQPSFRLVKQRVSQPETADSSQTSGWSEMLRSTIHQLLGLLDQMFQSLNEWMNVMEQGQNDYHLRQFLEQKISDSLADALWQRVDVQNYLANTVKDCVAPVSERSLNGFLPQWEKQSAQRVHPGSVPEAMDLLEQIYQQVFSCYVQVITSARQAFEQLSEQPCDFPDTALLIAFHRLLAFSQQGLNQYSHRHLQFYYQDILHQKIRTAVPDRTYLCLTLAPGHTSLNLPDGTTFVGGSYANKSPILFASVGGCEINTAQMGQLISSSYCPVEVQSPVAEAVSAEESNQKPAENTEQKKPAELPVSRQQRIEILPDSRQIRRNSAQQVLASDWFGGEQTQEIRQGFVFASPMLMLGSGVRTVTITLSLDQPVEVAAWQGAECWLSSAKKWFAVPEVQWTQGEAAHQLRLILTLQPDEPAVAAFAKPPAGYDGMLPYCRVMLPDTVDLQGIPRLLKLDFQVAVTQSHSFLLLSDNGPLVAGKPMPVLGAIPETGSHCYLSDAEVIGKPLIQLDFSLLWEKIPADFSKYYSAYNTFLHHQGGAKQTFDNTAFLVKWQVHTSDGWQPVSSQIFSVPDEDEAADSQHSEPKSKPHWWQRLWHRKPSQPQPIKQQNDGLFAQQHVTHKRKTTEENAPGTRYQLTFSEPQQCIAAPLTGQPQIRMTLMAPADGFGHAIYARLVSAISLDNAKVLMNGAGLLGPVVKVLRGLGHLVGLKSLGVVQPLPSLPWAVKAKQATLSYQAELSLDFTDPASALTGKTQDSSAFTLLHIGALATYPYFSRPAGQDAPGTDLRHLRLQPSSPDKTDSALPGLALYAGVSRPANSLYVQLTQVLLPCRVNLFIELAQDIDSEPQPSVVELYCWGENGWQSLSVLLDQTGGLTRSGIVQIDLPQNVVLNPPQFPDADAKTKGVVWLLMTQSSDRRVACVYCNTQGIEVARQTPIPLPAGESPVLNAGKISAPAVKNPALATVVQPFASFGGRAEESASVFRERVSKRLKTKDRAVACWDYALLARQACPSLFYVCRLPGDLPGSVHLGVVQSYSSSLTAHAFRPVVPRDQIQRVMAALTKRTSAMAQVRVSNLVHEPVSVVATLVIQATTNASELLNTLNEGMNLYLSPWIDTPQQQYSIEEGLSRTAVTRFLAGFTGIVAVPSLQLIIHGATPPDGKISSDGKTTATPSSDSSSPERMMPATPDRIFVSALKHTFQLTRAGTVSPESESSGVAQNQLTEAYS